jgi:hypothetical protein
MPYNTHDREVKRMTLQHRARVREAQMLGHVRHRGDQSARVVHRNLESRLSRQRHGCRETVLGPTGNPVNCRIAGLTTMTQAIVPNVVTPPSTSVRNVVPVLAELKNLLARTHPPAMSHPSSLNPS